MSDGPVVTIVVPVFNGDRFLASTLESVLAQDHSGWECIVVDDGSTDRSRDLAEQFVGRDPRVRLTSQENLGASAARQHGYSLASQTSRYLLFLDADDVLEPQFLTTFVQYLDSHPAVGMVYGACVRVDAAGELVEPPAVPARYRPAATRIRRVPDDEPATPLPALVSRHEAVPSATLLRRSAFARTQGWRSGHIVEDKDIAIQMALVAPVHFLPVFFTRYRHHDSNRSSDRFYDAMHNVHRLWWDDPSLSPASARQVRRALAFDQRVTAWMTWRELATEHDRRVSRASLNAATRALWRTVRWLSLEARAWLPRPTRRSRAGATH